MKQIHVPVNWDEVRQGIQDSDVALQNKLVADERALAQVYDERASQLAARHSGASARVRTTNFLICSLGAERYGIAVTSLREILPTTKCTPVPKAGLEVVGVINLRG